MRLASLRSKLPVALLAAAILLAAASTVAQRSDSTPDPVEEAIRAPFTDVGIPPVTVAVDFWQARASGDPADYLSRTRLATSILAEARETGDLTRYDEAEVVLREALALNPVGSEALLALGSARAADHDFRASRQLAEQVLDRLPSSAGARLAVADSNFELGKYDLARRQLADLVTVMPDGPALDIRRAREAGVEGRNDDAIAHAARAVITASELDLRPSEAAHYRFQLAHFLHRAGRLDDALAAVDAALAIDAAHLASRELRAQVLVSLGRLDEAASSYEALLADGPAADLHGELAKVYRALGRDAAAERQVALGIALGHEQLDRFPAERRHLAGFFADVEPATALAAALADFDTRRDVGAYDTLAWAYHRTGQHRLASRYLARALALGTNDATLRYHAGMIEAAAGHDEAAADHLAAALALDPNFDLEAAPIARATLEELSTR